jgi:L-aspartate oxidase
MAQPPVVIVGAGLAGLSAALALAPLPVLLISAAPIGEQASSGWAQGGIAAAIGADDSPALHAADTRAAGDGLCDPAVVARIIAAGPRLIAALRQSGVRFDADLGLEAAHGRRRIVHAADGTGREVMRALAERVRGTPSITLLHGQVRRLVVRDGTVTGVTLATGQSIAASQVVLATGGLGGLYAHTTNPRASWGQGLLLAAQAGAVLTDLEFVQFHPTALDTGRDPMPLISEAVRGEGATLIDETGARFTAELAPRDVVSRAVSAHLSAGHRVFLDATAMGTAFARHFPGITQACAESGLDPATQPIPVRPAAHYHMGGIATCADGATSVPGLYACGECSGTGLHGANRLASNSLLEAAICGAAVAEAIKSSPVALPARGVMRDQAASPPDRVAPVRPIMTAALGVLRHRAGMERAIGELLRLVDERGPSSGPATVGLLVALSALRREESRGAHCRTDYPDHAATARRSRITLTEAIAAARDLACVSV